MIKSEHINALTYVGDEPDINALRNSFELDVSGLVGYQDQVVDAWNQRRCWWPGKNKQLLKLEPGARPWQGASDMEVSVIDPRINTLVAMCMNAIRGGNISAIPVEGDDDERASAASTFLRWMFDSWIPNAYGEIEMAIQNMFECGIAAAFVGWEKRNRSHLEVIDIEEIAQVSPDLADLLTDPAREDDAIDLFENQFASLNRRSTKKALRQLREKGIAQIPVVKGDVDRPIISAKNPAVDIILPSYTMDVQRSSRAHLRMFMTPQDLEVAAASQGWDRGWVEDIIENHLGVTESDIDGEYGNRNATASNRSATLWNIGDQSAMDMALIVRTFLRMIDKDTGAEGIYECIWCPKQAKANPSENNFGKFELLNGYDEFPIVMVPLTKDSKRLYDVRNICDLLRGNQRQAKVTRDTFIDHQSIALNPPRRVPPGRPPSQWGAGAVFTARRGEEGLHDIIQIPDVTRQGVYLEEYLEKEADRIVGLEADNPYSPIRQQYYIDRALEFVSQLAQHAYRAYQKLYGKDEIHFRVTGNPDPQTFNRGPMDEKMDIKFYFDVRGQDREYVKETIEAIGAIQARDATGRIDPAASIDVATHLALPQYAGRLLRSTEKAQSDIIKDVAEDIALIWSGQSVQARQYGAQIAIQYIQGYLQKPSVQERLVTDTAFAEDIQSYAQGYEFQLQQMQNAEIGRTGQEPADVEQ